MKTVSKKIWAVTILAFMAVVMFWLGISMQMKPAVAASTSLLPDNIEVVNIEDVVNDITTDVYLHSTDVGASSQYIVYSPSNQSDIINKTTAMTGNNKTINLGIYTRAGLETDKDGNYVTNTSKYANNLSVYSSGTKATFLKLEIDDTPEAVRNTLIRVRIPYEANRPIQMSTRDGTSGWNGSRLNGAKFAFNTSSDNMIQLGTEAAISEATLLAKVNGEAGTRTSLFNEGDSLIITFGGYDVTNEDSTANTVLYFSVYNDTQGFMAIEQSATVATISNVIHGMVGFEVGAGGSHDALTIEGVSEPILLNSAAGEADSVNITGGTYAAGTQVKDIALPEGYAFLDNTAVLKEGINTFVVAYASEGYPAPYYGKYGKETTATIFAVNVTNLESVVDSVNDITYKTNASGVYLYDGTTGKGYENGTINNINTYTETINFPEKGTEYNVNWALYTEKGTGATTDISYWKRTGGGALVEETIEYNVNDYDGNLSFMNDSFYESDVWFNSAKLNRNSIISFRFNYEGNAMAFAIRSSGIQSEIWNSSSAFYKIKLSDVQNRPSIAVLKGNTALTDVNGATTSWDNAALLAEASLINGKTISTIYEQGDMLAVTYGAFDSQDASGEYDNVYIRVYNETKDHLVAEKVVKLTRDADIIGTDMGAMFHWSHTSAYYAYNRNAVTIAGINEPLISASYGAVAEDTYTEDDLFSSVAIPEGYIFADDASKTLVAGENKIKVNTVVSEYYGQTNVEIITELTVNASAKTRYQVTIKDAAGVAANDPVSIKDGESFTFAKIDRTKEFLAFKDSEGNLYNVGDSIVINENKEFTLVEIDFDMGEAELRIRNDANGSGGLRFISILDAADYANAIEALGSNVQFKTVIMPVSYVGASFDPSLESYSGTVLENINASLKDLDTRFTDEGKIYSKFYVTDMLYHNYHAKYMGAAWIEITYADGEKAYVVKQETACAYDLALALYAEGDVALSFGTTAAEIIETYVFGVIDLTYTANGESFDIGMTENANGLDQVGYFTSLAQGGSVANGEYITVKINVTENVEELIEGKTYVPIILRDSSNLGQYKMAIGTTPVYENGVLTITFKCVI